MIDLEQAFTAAEDEFLKYDRIEKPLHPCPDICAFLRLSELVPSKPGRDMISAAEHDEYFIDVDCEELAKVATQEDVVLLHRCGVRYSSEFDCLAMFA